jgi:hypothetical protein
VVDRELQTERARSADSEKAAKQLVQAKEKQLEEHELGLTEKQKELEALAANSEEQAKKHQQILTEAAAELSAKEKNNATIQKTLHEKQQEFQEFQKLQEEHAADTTKKTAELQHQLQTAQKLNTGEQVKAAAELQEAQTRLTELQERKMEEEKKAAERIQVKENEITELTSKLASERKAAQAEYEQLKEASAMEAAEAVSKAETVSKAQKDQELSRKRQLEKSAAELEDAKTALEQKGKDLAAVEAQHVELSAEYEKCVKCNSEQVDQNSQTENYQVVSLAVQTDPVSSANVGTQSTRSARGDWQEVDVRDFVRVQSCGTVCGKLLHGAALFEHGVVEHYYRVCDCAWQYFNIRFAKTFLPTGGDARGDARRKRRRLLWKAGCFILKS